MIAASVVDDFGLQPRLRYEISHSYEGRAIFSCLGDFRLFNPTWNLGSGTSASSLYRLKHRYMKQVRAIHTYETPLSGQPFWLIFYALQSRANAANYRRRRHGRDPEGEIAETPDVLG